MRKLSFFRKIERSYTQRLHGPSFMFDFRIVVKDEVLHGAVGTKGWDFFSTPGI
jgi:hypothetical protein